MPYSSCRLSFKILNESFPTAINIGFALTDMIKHDLGVFTEYNYSIKKIDSDFFEDE